MDNALPSICQADYGQLVKMFLTLEPDGIFRINFAYLFIITLFQLFGGIYLLPRALVGTLFGGAKPFTNFWQRAFL